MSFMLTSTNKEFHYQNLSPEMIDIKDIAAHLSKICRFFGSVPYFYSVAEHSLAVCELVDDEYKLEALLHDSSEAYLGDIVKPLKNLLPDYQKLEKQVELAIADKFGLPKIMTTIVANADNQALKYEFLHVRTGRLIGMSPEEAEKQFLNKYWELIG